jgi:1-deoxy-D-xylulose-5-phosphate synthase
VAVRYPRGGEGNFRDDTSGVPVAVVKPGEDITLVTFGTLTGRLLQVAKRLEADGISAEVVKLNRLAPFCPEVVLASLRKTHRLLVAEECVSMGGPGQDVLAAAAADGIPLKGCAVCSCGEGFVPHGTVEQLRALCGLDEDSLYEKAREVANHGK